MLNLNNFQQKSHVFIIAVTIETPLGCRWSSWLSCTSDFNKSTLHWLVWIRKSLTMIFSGYATWIQASERDPITPCYRPAEASQAGTQASGESQVCLIYGWLKTHYSTILKLQHTGYICDLFFISLRPHSPRPRLSRSTSSSGPITTVGTLLKLNPGVCHMLNMCF